MSLIDLINKKSLLPSSSEALLGRTEEIEVPPEHFVKGTPLKGPFSETFETAIFGMGCFWGVEKIFWEMSNAHMFKHPYRNNTVECTSLFPVIS